MTKLYFKQLLLGPMENFVYLIGDREHNSCLVVDPAWDVNAILKAAEQDGMKISGALVTHYHPDHCGGHLWGHDIEGVSELIAKNPVPVYAHKDEISGLMKVTGLSKQDFKACESGDHINVGDMKLTTIHTPGHTPGSQCFLVEDHLVSGDTLFISGCGRVDLPGSNPDKMYDSLTNKLAKLPEHTVVFPGHNYDTKQSASLKEVKKINRYLSAASLKQWHQMFGL